MWLDGHKIENNSSFIQQVLDREQFEKLDIFDLAQLEAVISVCRKSASVSEASRTLFAVSRLERSTTNDADRLRKYLARFGLTFQQVQ